LREFVGEADGEGTGITLVFRFVDSVLLMRIALVAFGSNWGCVLPFRDLKKQSDPTPLLGM